MVYEIVLLTLALELLTIAGRAFFGSNKARFKKNTFKYKVRIHHGYVGAALVALNVLFPSELLLITGATLFFSDAIHHFLVLPLWVGRTEFP